MARECGAKKVYFASAAPPVRFPNVYGIDMPSRSELIATGRDTAQIAQAIGADAVFYQDLADLIEDVRSCNPAIKSFDASCFDGTYITGGVSDEYLAGIEANRNDGESSGGAGEEGSRTHQLDLGLSTVDP
jgi:amidophosphoribosyltransferase